MTTTSDELASLFQSLTRPQQLAIIEQSTPAEADMLSQLLRSGNTQYATPLDLLSGLYDNFVSRPHLDYLSERLTRAVEKVEGGQSHFMCVSLPPRAGKSTLISTGLPIYCLARHPSWKIGLLSNAKNLAVSWGREVRRYVTENPSLGIQVAPDAGAVTDWQTTRRGGVTSRSVGQPVVGLGFKVMILDDIVKDYATAHSFAHREAVWNWYSADAYSRIEEPALVALVGTRWHADDVIGRVLSAEYAGNPEDWEVINLPAIADTGDVLGREQGDPLFTPFMQSSDPADAVEYWRKIKRSVGEYVWSALYQGSPTPAKGQVFDADTFQYYLQKDLPTAFEKRWTSWDAAFKGTVTSDYVVGQYWGLAGGVAYLLDQVRGKWTFTQTISKMKSLIEPAPFALNEDVLITSGAWADAKQHLVEDAANGPAIVDTLGQSIPGLKAVKPDGDKVARARSVTPLFEAGKVKFPSPEERPWVSGLVSELKALPSGKNDDQCFHRDTFVETPKGSVPIIEIKVGDTVLGGTGWVEVLAAKMTGVHQVIEHNGLVGTVNHPILTQTGWKPLSAVRRADKLLSGLRRTAGVERAINDGTNALNPDQTYLLNENYARREATKSGIACPAAYAGSRAYLSRPLRCAGLVGCDETPSLWNVSLCTESSLDVTRTPVTPPIEDTFAQVRLMSSEESTPCIEKCIDGKLDRFRPDTKFTTWTATQEITRQAILSPLHVPNTEHLPLLPGKCEAGHGEIEALCLPTWRLSAPSLPKPAGTCETYNLTTSDGTYFANGVLTHNCDALSQALRQVRIRRPGGTSVVKKWLHKKLPGA